MTWAKIIVDLFAAAVCGVIGWHSYRLVREEMGWGDTIFDDLPVWLLHTIVPLAFILISYRFLVRVATLARSLFVPSDEEATP